MGIKTRNKLGANNDRRPETEVQWRQHRESPPPCFERGLQRSREGFYATVLIFSSVGAISRTAESASRQVPLQVHPLFWWETLVVLTIIITSR